MKSLIFFLVCNIVLCYTGLGANVCYSSSLPNMPNCHMSHSDRISSVEKTANSYKDTDAVNHAMSMCQDALLNAPHSYDSNLKYIILYSLAVNIPVLEINTVPSFSLNLALKTEYRPPDLFLANSSFLL